MKLGNFNLRNLRQRDVALIIIGLTIIAAVVWFFYLYRPTQDRIASLENDIMVIDQQIVQGERAKAALPELQLEVARLEREREAFLRQLPRESDVAGLLDQLRASASDADVVLNAISQGNAAEDIQEVRPIGFNIATEGNYADTMTFLSELETLPRFTKIRQVGLSAADEGSTDPGLNATYSVVVYVFIGEDPGAQP